MKFFHLVSLGLLLAAVALAAPKSRSLDDASNGPPQHQVDGAMNKTAYVKLTAKKFKQANVIYVDREALKQVGVRVPENTYDPAFLWQINNEWAYGVEQDDDEPGLFGKETKVFYADRYGGRGTGALGSGRAAAAGLFQVKGFLTPLAQKYSDALNDEGYSTGEGGLLGRIKDAIGKKLSAKVHTHGKLALRQAIVEQIWSSLLDSELPLGSNRLPFVITTGQHVTWQGPLTEPAALTVRLDPIRPAHFIESQVAQDPKAERARMAELVEGLPAVLPQPAGAKPATDAEKLHEGMLEFARRVGRQFGTMYAKGFFHGSNSPSNIQLDGKTLDLSSMTWLDGFPNALYVDDHPNGDLRVPQEDILEDMIASLKKTVAPELRASLPSKKEMYAALGDAYQKQLDHDFLWLTGTPPELLDSMASRPAAQELTAILQKMAKSGNMTLVHTLEGVPENENGYDFEDMMTALTDGMGKHSLADAVPGNKQRAELFDAYTKYVAELTPIASKAGIKEVNLKMYLRLAAAQRNRKLGDIMRGKDQWQALAKLILKFQLDGDAGPIRDFIDSTIQANLRTFRDAPEFSVVLSNHATPEAGNTIYQVFDAKAGVRRVVVNAELTEGSVNLFGRSVPLDTLKASKLYLTHEGARAMHQSLELTGPDRVTLTLPNFDLDDGFGVRVQLPDGHAMQFQDVAGADGIFRPRSIGGGGENCIARFAARMGETWSRGAAAVGEGLGRLNPLGR
jgi:uncharacterized protein YdiU (UPF0061 family)